MDKTNGKIREILYRERKKYSVKKKKKRKEKKCIN